jgi:hypothetical protein
MEGDEQRREEVLQANSNCLRGKKSRQTKEHYCVLAAKTQFRGPLAKPSLLWVYARVGEIDTAVPFQA